MNLNVFLSISDPEYKSNMFGPGTYSGTFAKLLEFSLNKKGYGKVKFYTDEKGIFAAHPSKIKKIRLNCAKGSESIEDWEKKIEKVLAV